VQRLKGHRDIAFEMDPQRAPAAFEQNIKVAAGLRVLHYAETGAVSGSGDIRGVVGGDLQKHSAVRTAFIGLTG